MAEVSATIHLGPTELAQSNAPAHQLKSLTSIRFFAAMHVVAYHFGRHTFEKIADELGRGTNKHGIAGRVIAPAIRNSVHSGYVSVSLFFVLSGFILAYNYLDPSRKRTTKAQDFWLARFARIYPVYLMGLILAAHDWLASPGGSRTKLGAAFTSPLLLQSWFPTLAFQWNSPGWSLSVEAFFYLMFPILFASAMCGMKESRTIITPKRRVALIAGLWLAALTGPVLYLLIRPDRIPFQALVNNGLDSGPGVWLAALNVNPLLKLPEFLIGVMLGQLFLEDLRNDRRPSKWLTGLSIPVLAVIIAVSGQIPYPMLHNGLLAPLFALLIYHLAHDGWPGKYLSGRWIVLLGEASYALYILHYPLGHLLINGAAHLGKSGVDLPFPLRSLLLVVASVVTFKCYEVPARDWIKNALQRRRAGAGASVPAGV